MIGSTFIFAAEMTYVNLQLNPERYTGYTGPSARRIWDAVYAENCPKCKLLLSLSAPMLVKMVAYFTQLTRVLNLKSTS